MAVELPTVGTGAVALVSAVALALVNSWITARAGIDGELRSKRLEVYPPLWQATAAISRWPRNDLSHKALVDLHRDLRTWYYGTGGLFLSERARARYGDVQKRIAVLVEHEVEPACVLVDDRYDDLMKTASSLRTALTEDLDTRRRTSLLERGRRLLRRWRAKRGAHARIARARGRQPVFRAPSANES
jgi:hypothetical protein